MAEMPETGSQLKSLDEILADYHCAIDAGKNPDPRDYLVRYPEYRQQLEQALYSQLDADAVLTKILDNILDQLFKVFEQADRAFVIFREGMSRRLVVKASRTRSPQDGDSTQVLRSGKLVPCLDHATAFCDHKCLRSEFYEGPVEGIYGFLVMCAPMCDPSGEAFGAIWLEAEYNRGTFAQEDLDLLRGTVEGVIPPWIVPFISG